MKLQSKINLVTNYNYLKTMSTITQMCIKPLNSMKKIRLQVTMDVYVNNHRKKIDDFVKRDIDLHL